MKGLLGKMTGESCCHKCRRFCVRGSDVSGPTPVGMSYGSFLELIRKFWMNQDLNPKNGAS